MLRAIFQVLVYAYRRNDTGQLEYALLKRVDQEFWQGIAVVVKLKNNKKVRSKNTYHKQSGDQTKIYVKLLFPDSVHNNKMLVDPHRC